MVNETYDLTLTSTKKKEIPNSQVVQNEYRCDNGRFVDAKVAISTDGAFTKKY